MTRVRRSRAETKLAGLLLILLLAPGCDRRIEPYDPAEKPAQPDLAHIFPAPQPDVAAAMGAGVSAAAGAAGPAASQPAGKAIRGRITLAEGAEAEAAAVLFIIARRAGASGGPPLAVQRIMDPRFPADFEIGPEQVMIPSLRFEGPIDLSARLDADGNPMSRDEGDLEARSAAPLQPGSDGVDLVLGP